MYHDNKYETMSKTAKNIYARSFMIEIPEIHRTIEHRVMSITITMTITLIVCNCN